MDIILALLIQAAIMPNDTASAPDPRLAYANAAADQNAPRPRINQGRSFRTDLNALDDSLAIESRQERSPRAATRPAPARPAPGRTTQWNGVPVRVIDGQRHGVW